ncbi:MAG: thioredoxin domain-containing protein [Gammaproteobacteria bacterium]
MNALANETSPYLLQHADNPVAWYPWGPEALGRARSENKPILLSLGYSACHWCHVMAHESFEDEDTAALMNEHFVNIKVDREERPDLDKIYQMAQHLLSGRNGGWPLTMFLTPGDHTPFFGGTYFPREAHYGLPSFKEVLAGVARFFREHPEDAREQGEALRQALNERAAPAGQVALDGVPLTQARAELERIYDRRLGGFGGAPKFPHPTSIERLLRHYAATAKVDAPDGEALQMALHTLRAMAQGGVYDQLGGGFYRYSVDAEWRIPHFEKMLYDNAQLLPLYAEAWQLTGEPVFETTALETGDWVMREMQSPEGGFYSSLDADSAGHEGAFYVWSEEEVRSALGDRAYSLFARHVGLDRPPNFEGRWHFYIAESAAAIAGALETEEAEVVRHIAEARSRLLALREPRIRPGRDEKVLTSWNALMIRGLAIAGRIFRRDDFLSSAERAMDFLRATLWRDGRLLATYKDGRAHLNAYLDDHAFLIDALLSLLEARWRAGEMELAIALCDVLIERFEDPEGGGFYFTAHDHERLIARHKSLMDEALPAGAGVAAYGLGRLGHLLGEARYLAAAERTLRAASGSIGRYASGHCALLRALEEYRVPPTTVVLRGDGEPLAAWQRRCHEHYAPARLTLAIPTDASGLPGVLALCHAADQGVVAYICEGAQCGAPIRDLAALDEAIRKEDRGGTALPD